MKTPYNIFKDHPAIEKHPAVQELIMEYESVCDALIDLQQVKEMNKELPLKILVNEILGSISTTLKSDEEALRFKETQRVDFKASVQNLQRYIFSYLNDYGIRL